MQEFRGRLTAILPALPLLCFSAVALANEHENDNGIEQVVVYGQKIRKLERTGDAAEQLSRQGVDFSSAGGISSLPVVHGLNDDRVRLVIDGAETTSACANHMNPALSYIDASRIQTVDVIAGITPVSAGGDSTAGTIVIQSEQPEFSTTADELLSNGTISYFYSSNNHNQGAALSATLASDKFSLIYSGSYDKADSYEDGRGNKVLDTLYRSESHNLTAGYRGEQQALTLKFSHHKVPYQGFPNQYMDMVDNSSYALNLDYLQQFSWGNLDTRITWQDVEHEMGFFTDEKLGSMPMITEGRDIGYRIAAEVPAGERGTIRLGNEYHEFTLDDWWPAVPGNMMMGPNDYVNINDGERTRYAVYAESENRWGSSWETIAGLRFEHVVTDTDDVQPYNAMGIDASAAAAFNARDHRQTDDNFDITALARYRFLNNYSMEFGYARKTRSPNLYERYSWGRSPMAMTMIGWFGDGNGYVGDIDLKPEIAHTASVTLTWQEDDNNLLAVTPYYTFVDNFIDVRQIGSVHPRMAMAVSRPALQFTNLDAELYGLEIEGRQQLFNDGLNSLQLDTRIAYTRGKRKNAEGDLYHIMPWNMRAALEYVRKVWSNRLELEWVDRKNNVDDRHKELPTDSYALVNLSTQYEWQQVTVSVGVRNLFDSYYELALGGAYLSDWIASSRTEQFENLPGAGRSFEFGVSYQF